MNFTNAAYFCLALAAVSLFTLIWLKRRQEAAHPPTVLRHYEAPGHVRFKAISAAPVIKHVHMLRVGRSSVERLTEGVQFRCCVAGCEEPFYMDGETVAWVRDWLNATRADSVKVQAIR